MSVSNVLLAFDRSILERDFVAFDRAGAPSARTFDKDGRMTVEGCRISKANVCPYYGREIPRAAQLGLDPNKIYMMYRDPKEMEKAAPTFRNLQLLVKHTKIDANDSKKDLTVGTIGNVAFDGNYLVAGHLTVWDNMGIALIESKQARELSCSYHYVADMTPGVSHDGVAYDGRMCEIMGNHVALVKHGRAGSDVYVNDEQISLESSTMKRPFLLAQLLASGLVVAASDTEKLALDSKLADMTAKDGEAEEMEDDPENPGAKRKKGKKANPGKGEAGEPGGALASDAQIEAAIQAKGYVTLADAKVLAEDAALRATADATSNINALHAAREAVKPLVGVVALDSAEAVYKFALDQEKVAHDGVHPSAFPALIAQVVARKSAIPAAQTTTPVMAADTALAALPGLGRIVVSPSK